MKMFLGVTADVTDWNDEGNACTLVLQDNPLNDFVELPPSMVGSLHYSNLLCGVIQGALEQVRKTLGSFLESCTSDSFTLCDPAGIFCWFCIFWLTPSITCCI